MVPFLELASRRNPGELPILSFEGNRSGLWFKATPILAHPLVSTLCHNMYTNQFRPVHQSLLLLYLSILFPTVAGMVGLLKLASLLSCDCMPSNLHLHDLNQHIAEDIGDFAVQFPSEACILDSLRRHPSYSFKS